MKDFGSPAEFAAFFDKVITTLPVAQAIGLDLAAAEIQHEAKTEIGSYQDAVGPFAEWAELADYTKQDRVAQGFTENDPLLRTGEMRDSIKRNSDANTAYVGSDSDIALWQELGTDKIPARSFLGGAAVRKSDETVEIIADAVVAHILNTARKHYEMDDDE